VIQEDLQSIYRSGVGMLLYMLKSRPDLGNPVRELTKCVQGAHPAAYKEMQRVIKFLLDTKHYGLKIEPNNQDNQEWKLLAYSDSDWAGDKDDLNQQEGC